MGRIVKSATGAARPGVQDASTGELAGAEAVAAEVTRVLVAARAAANADRLAAKDAAVVLARRMAEKIVGHAVEMDPEVMCEIAAQALAATGPGKEPVLLRVHPEDLASLEESRGGWLARVRTKADVRTVADASVGRHGCIVETADVRLDARLDTQLEALERALRGAGIGRS
jgi:flagellar assembly protein FliH